MSHNKEINIHISFVLNHGLDRPLHESFRVRPIYHMLKIEITNTGRGVSEVYTLYIIYNIYIIFISNKYVIYNM